MDNDLYTIEEQNDNIEQTVEIIEVDDIETYDIDSEVAFPALGERNEKLKHELWSGRDFPDQHPITAITGLREELDNLEALQTIFSDKKQIADYYRWEDRNPTNEDRLGFFVSLCKNSTDIKICSGKDIYGVIAYDAAFVGGQNDIPRDNSYGLVIHTGVALVRCELDVKAGDFVTSSSFGVAQKSNVDYGHKVIAISKINGIRCAVVPLNLPIDQVDAMAQKFKLIDSDLEGLGNNIDEIMNLLKQLSKDVKKAGEDADDAKKSSSDANSKYQSTYDRLLDMDKKAAEAKILSEEADKIAAEALASAKKAEIETKQEIDEGLRLLNEAKVEMSENLDNAVAGINESLLNIQQSKKELEDDLSEVKEKVNERLKNIETTAGEMQNTVNDAKRELAEDVQNMKDLTKYLEPLITWDDGQGVGGFVAHVDGNTATMGDILYYLDPKGEIIAGRTQTIGENYASASDLVAVNTANSVAIGEFKREVTDTYTKTVDLDQYLTDKSDAFAGIVKTTNANQSLLEAITSYEYTDNNNKTVKGLAGIRDEVDKNSAEVSAVADFEYGEQQKIYPYANSPAPNENKETIGDHKESGITFSDNGKKRITANGTATANAYFRFVYNNNTFSEGDYSVSGCPTGGGSTTYCIEVVIKRVSDNTTEYWHDTGNETKPCKFKLYKGDTISIRIKICKDYKVEDLEFVPSFKKIVSTGLSGLALQASKNSSTIDLLTTFSVDDATGIAGLIAEVGKQGSELKTLAQWRSNHVDENNVDSISVMKQIATENQAALKAAVEYNSEHGKGIAGLIALAEKNESSITTLTNFTKLGPNLIPVEFSTNQTTTNGITFTNNKDGTFTVKGKTSSDKTATFTLVNKLNLDKGSYILSGNTFGNKARIYFELNGEYIKDTGNDVKFTLSEKKEIKLCFIVLENTEINQKFRPKLQRITSDGIAGLEARVNSSEAELSTLAGFEYGDNKGIAGLKACVDKNSAEVNTIASYDYKNGNSGAAGLLALVQKNSSEVEAVANFEYKNSKGMAGMRSMVENNQSKVDSLASFTQLGANLIPIEFPDDEITSGGLTITNNKDGTVTINGTAPQSSNVNYWFMPAEKVLTLGAGDYVLSGNTLKDDTLTVYLQYGDKKFIIDRGDGIDFTLTKKSDGKFYLTVKSDSHPKDNINDIKLEDSKMRAGMVVMEGKTLTNKKIRPKLQKKLSEGISGLVSTVTSNGSSLDLLSQHSYRDSNGYLRSGVSGMMTEVQDNSAILRLATNYMCVGDNELKYPYKSKTSTDKTGIYFVDNGNGTISVKGTGEGTTKYFVINDIELERGTYVLSGNPVLDNDNFVLEAHPSGTNLYYRDKGNKIQFTLDSKQTVRIQIVVKKKTASTTRVVEPYLGKFISDGFAGLIQDVDNRKSETIIMNTWKSKTNETIADLRVLADENEASIAQVVEGKGKDGKIKTASIVTAINKDKGSVVKLKADCIALEGFTTINDAFQIDEEGFMRTTGGSIGNLTIENQKLYGVTEWYDKDKKKYISYTSGINSRYHTTSKNEIFLWAGCRLEKDVAGRPYKIFGAVDATNAYSAITNSANFYITHTGKLYAKKAEIEGKIEANSGKIGNWVIKDTVLYSDIKASDNNYYSCGMSNESTGNKAVVFWAGYDGAQSTPTEGYHYYKNNNITNTSWQAHTPFYVTRDGEVHASNAYIEGNIKATSGTIGGWTIAAGSMSCQKDSTHKVTLRKPNEWTTTSQSDVLVIQNGADKWPFVLKANGRLTATDAYITGTINATSGSFSNSVTIGGTTITAGDLRKLFRGARGYTSDCLDITRITATSGTIGGWSISSDGIYGRSTYGNVGISISTLYVGEGTGGGSTRWYFVYGAAKNYENQYSDKRLKTNIENLSNQYEQLFDTLQPKRYKYIDGTSNRYHTGFVAQEVMDSVNNAGLTSQDFAAVCLEGINAEKEGYWQLRRDEFIALNTWQIQKAKARISELEEKVSKLEQLIKEK